MSRRIPKYGFMNVLGPDIESINLIFFKELKELFISSDGYRTKLIVIPLFSENTFYGMSSKSSSMLVCTKLANKSARP